MVAGPYEWKICCSLPGDIPPQIAARLHASEFFYICGSPALTNGIARSLLLYVLPGQMLYERPPSYVTGSEEIFELAHLRYATAGGQLVR